MLVRERMTPNPITISKEATIAHALQTMRENKIRRLPVVDGTKLVGIVTDRDISEVSPSPATSLSIFELNYLLSKTKIGDILPKDRKVITVDPDAFIEDAALLMRNHKIGAIPVLEKGQVIGIITETNIFDAFIEFMGFRQDGYRITIKLGVDRPGVLAEITKIIASYGGNITHSNTFGDGTQSTLIFRINAGEADKIAAALNENGYKVDSIIQTFAENNK